MKISCVEQFLSSFFFRTYECWASWGSKSGFPRELWGGVRSPTQPLVHHPLPPHQHPKSSLTFISMPPFQEWPTTRSPVQPSPSLPPYFRVQVVDSGEEAQIYILGVPDRLEDIKSLLIRSRVQEEASLASGPLSKDPLRRLPDF